MIRTVAVFGSGVILPGTTGYKEAHELGQLLGKAGYIVATGGYGGLMEAVSRGAQETGGHTMGVTCKQFQSRSNHWLDEEISTETFKDRLFYLVALGEAYIALRGGTGTLCEVMVAWEMMRKGLMPAKPLILCGRYWRNILNPLTDVEGGAEFLRFVDTPQEAVQCLK